MSDDTIPAARTRGRVPDSARIKIKGKWTAVSNRLLVDQRLSRDARLLGCLLFMHAGNAGRTFPSQEELAAELSFVAQVPVTDEHGKAVKDAAGLPLTQEVRREITTRSIQRWLAELREAGWLGWRQTTRNNEYTLLDPAEYEGVTPADNDDAPVHTILTRATEVSLYTTERSQSPYYEDSLNLN